MQEIKIALVGQPNVGKTSLINNLSGTHLKVGNFSGVTIEKAEASLVYKNTLFTIIDLPGTYALNDFTQEEKITKDFLKNADYDVILNVVDSTNLERNLALSVQVMALQKKCLIALNMSDEAKKENIQIDSKQLSNILGIKCIPTSAVQSDYKNELLDEILSLHAKPFSPPKYFYSQELEERIKEIEDFLDSRDYPEIKKFILDNNPNYTNRTIAILLLSQDEQIYSFLHDKPAYVELTPKVRAALEILSKHTDNPNINTIFLNNESAFIRGAIQECVKQVPQSLSLTRRIDRIFLHKYFGLPIFLFFMFIVFNLSFLVGGFFQDSIDSGIADLGDFVAGLIPDEELGSLIGNGIIGGVGAVISFLPLIVILYLGISLLEGTGYMARVAFLLDGIFHKFGLHGKSFIPLVTGFGCSVPAYMATRTLQNKNERFITLFVIGFMSCSARLPIYVLFIGTFFPDKYAGIVLFCVYILGAVVALLMAKLLKLTIFSGKDEPFVMEMPKYRLPSFRLVYFGIYTKVLMYLKKAGTFILFGAVLIWFLAQYPKNEAISYEYTQKIEQVEKSSMSAEDKDQEIRYLKNERSEILLRHSYAGWLGEMIAPIFSPMHFDWRLSISLITGFAAKETLVSTLGVLYALGDSQDESSKGLQQAIRNSISMPTAVAFIIFIIFYIPCFAAVITFGRESGGIKSVLGLFIFTSIVAYVFALLGYYIAFYSYWA